MTETTENHTIRLLKEMRSEIGQQLTELRAQVGVLAQGQNSIRNDLGQIKLHIQEMAIVLDHHGTRLDAIEHHLGLAEPKH